MITGSAQFNAKAFSLVIFGEGLMECNGIGRDSPSCAAEAGDEKYKCLLAARERGVCQFSLDCLNS